MKNIINKIKKVSVYVFALIMSLLFKLEVAADGAGDPAKLGEALEKLQPSLIEIIEPVSAVLIFLSVMFLGVNMIYKSKKADDRTNNMMAFVGIAVGAFILGSIGVIYSFIMSMAID